MSVTKIFVTGANGFIGHHLCKKLLEINHEVFGLTRNNNPKNLLSLKENENFNIVNGNLNDIQFLTDFFNKFEIDTIIHLAIAAPQNSFQTSLQKIPESQEYQTNFLGTLNLLDAANQASVKIWIHSSTMSVYDYNKPQYLPVDENHPISPGEIYGFSKLLAENACNFYHHNFGFNIIILRYSGVYGIGKNHGLIAKFTRQCLVESSDSFNASTNRTSDFVYVDDVVNANSLALKKLSNHQKKSPIFDVFNIGSGHETSVYEIVNTIKKLTDSKIKIVQEKSDNSRKFYFNCNKAIKQLNYKPNSTNDGLQKYISKIINSKS